MCATVDVREGAGLGAAERAAQRPGLASSVVNAAMGAVGLGGAPAEPEAMLSFVSKPLDFQSPAMSACAANLRRWQHSPVTLRVASRLFRPGVAYTGTAFITDSGAGAAPRGARPAGSPAHPAACAQPRSSSWTRSSSRPTRQPQTAARHAARCCGVPL